MENRVQEENIYYSMEIFPSEKLKLEIFGFKSFTLSTNTIFMQRINGVFLKKEKYVIIIILSAIT